MFYIFNLSTSTFLAHSFFSGHPCHLSVCQPNGPYSDGIQIVNCSAMVTASKGNYMLSISVQGDIISFTVSAPTTGWVGIGFSLDQSMVRPMNGKCIWLVLCNNQRSYGIDLFSVQLNTDTIIGAHDTSSGEVLLYDGSVLHWHALIATCA